MRCNAGNNEPAVTWNAPSEIWSIRREIPRPWNSPSPMAFKIKRSRVPWTTGILGLDKQRLLSKSDMSLPKPEAPCQSKSRVGPLRGKQHELLATPSRFEIVCAEVQPRGK